MAISEGTAFAQKGKAKTKPRGDEKKKEHCEAKQSKNDKKFFSDKECFVCGKICHGAKTCPNKKKLKCDDTDDSSISSKSSKVEELEKKLKHASKQFTQLKAQFEALDESSSDGDNLSNFQLLHFLTEHHHMPHDTFYNNVSSKQSKGRLHDLPLRKIILLDNQSTMSLFCNERLVSNIHGATKPLTLQSNGGTMQVRQQASIGKGKPTVWFSKNAINNILSLKEVTKEYHVTYDSYNAVFIVWREKKGLPNMTFQMHQSGLHYFDPAKEEFSFVVTVDDNMKMYSKQQITGAEKARNLQASLAFPSDTDMSWILKANQVKECPVNHEDAVAANKIWGRHPASLKGKTARRKPDPVQTDMLEVPTEIRDLHRLVTISIDIFFINKIPFFLTLSRKICFSTVIHLANRKISTIFAAFKSIFTYYLQKGFQIMTVTANNEFAPLAELLYELPGAPTLNLTSANFVL